MTTPEDTFDGFIPKTQILTPPQFSDLMAAV
jgi:hypothetical protein